MAIVLQPATKILKPMKVLLYGPSFSGKTLSSLYLAVGIIMAKRGCTEAEAWKYIILIDSEYGRGALYSKEGPYNYLEIKAPYDTNKLSDKIKELNIMDEIDVVITDLLTHFWTKEGGILSEKAAKDKKGGNTYTNWLDSTAKFNQMLDEILGSPKIILSTSRSKNDTVIDTSSGKSVPKTYGLKPELRDGIEYDFDIVFNVDKSTHNLILEKGIPGMLPVYDIATPALGKHFYDLFTADAIVPIRTEADVADSIRQLAKNNNLIAFVQIKLSGRKLEDMSLVDIENFEAEVIKEIKRLQTKR